MEDSSSKRQGAAPRVSQKQQRKLAKQGQGEEGGEWQGCRKWLTTKSRFCSQTRRPDATYCPLHEAELRQPEDRVACPLDPAHTVARSALQAHLKVCQSAKQGNAMASQPFYCKDINSGRSRTRVADTAHDQLQRPGDGAAADAQGAAPREQQLLQPLLHRPMAKVGGARLEGEDLKALLARMEAAYAALIGDVPTQQLHPEECAPLFAAADAAGTEPRRLRHIVQQVRLLEDKCDGYARAVCCGVLAYCCFHHLV
jgi:U11-48K-like CHHC zinc finger/CCCH zinc finger in TRM13 protein